MKWLGIVVLLIVLVGLLAVIIGWLLPVAHAATVSRLVSGAPADVWEALTTPEAFADWRRDVDEVERLPDRDGLPTWREHGSSGTLTLEVAEWEPPSRLVTRIADHGLPFGGTWTYVLEPADAGTQVTITEIGEVYNPLFRFMSRFVFGHERTMRVYLDGLEARMAGVTAGAASSSLPAAARDPAGTASAAPGAASDPARTP